MGIKANRWRKRANARSTFFERNSHIPITDETARVFDTAFNMGWRTGRKLEQRLRGRK